MSTFISWQRSAFETSSRVFNPLAVEQAYVYPLIAVGFFRNQQSCFFLPANRWTSLSLTLDSGYRVWDVVTLARSSTDNWTSQRLSSDNCRRLRRAAVFFNSLTVEQAYIPWQRSKFFYPAVVFFQSPKKWRSPRLSAAARNYPLTIDHDSGHFFTQQSCFLSSNRWTSLSLSPDSGVFF